MSMTPLINPFTGHFVFGLIPRMKLGGVEYPESNVFLFQGRHIGPNRGFGALHIWAEHRTEMAKVGLLTEVDVSRYVLEIVKTGTPLYFECTSWQKTRLMAVRSSRGTAILEFRERREGAVWTIVTAFSGTKTHGARVGTVR